MSYRSKLWFSEQVLNELFSTLRNRDVRIDQREVIARLDQVVNAMGKASLLANFKAGFLGIDDQFVLTTEWITVTDPANNGASYFQLPVTSYIELPDNRGIDQVYFENAFSGANSVKKKYFDPILIRSYKELSMYRKNMATEMQGRISVFPKGGYLYFDRGNIASTYGRVGTRLVVRDASVLADDAPYIIPANLENEVIATLVAYFRERINSPKDLIKDKVSPN